MKYISLIVLLFGFKLSFGLLTTSPDSIRGALRPERNCFDITYYDLEVAIDPDEKRIVGKNDIYFTCLETAKTIQIDLFNSYEVKTVQLFAPIDSTGLSELISASYKKIKNALFISFADSIIEERDYKLTISYSGVPNVAKKAPWDGGFVWGKDSLDRHFCGVACEGWGASSWWPCKDHLSDEPDSMKLTFIVPNGYDCISNGKLVKRNTIQELGEDSLIFERFTWKVSYPINTYNVTFYLGKFKKIEDWYVSGGDSLKTEFYALDYNYKKAKNHFEQVAPMLRVYDGLFGKYPFWNDGYKLVEAPYLGMEHQSAIAYGNEYNKGYMGHHPEGIEFDYIIIHETGHEYWGNSVSMDDIADMWIHEGFCTYTEVLYVEKLYGYDASINYLKSQRNFKNDKPIIGSYSINVEGSGDMYNKGSWILHTIRNYISNDSLWFATLKQFHFDFKISNTNTQEVLKWFELKLGKDVSVLMRRYLYEASIPVLEYEKKSFLWMKSFRYRWKLEEESFNLPIEVNGKVVVPSEEWAKIRVRNYKKIRKQFDWRFAAYDIEEFGAKKEE